MEKNWLVGQIKEVLVCRRPISADNTWKGVGLHFGKVFGIKPNFCVCCWLDVSKRRGGLLSAIRGCDNGLFNIQFVFVFWLFPRIGSQNTSEHKTNLEKHSVAAPSVRADVLSSLATKLNLNSSKLNLSPLSPPRCVFISRPRNVVLLLCACVNKGCVRTWPAEAGGRRGFTVMSIKEKQNMKTGQSTAAQARPYLESTADLFELLNSRQAWQGDRH